MLSSSAFRFIWGLIPGQSAHPGWLRLVILLYSSIVNSLRACQVLQISWQWPYNQTRKLTTCPEKKYVTEHFHSYSSFIPFAVLLPHILRSPPSYSPGWSDHKSSAYCPPFIKLAFTVLRHCDYSQFSSNVQAVELSLTTSASQS